MKDMTDIKKCLEIIKQNAVAYKKHQQRDGLKIPREVADTLIQLYDDNDNNKIAVPVEALNEAIGFKSNLTRARASMLKRKLNEQYYDRLEKGEEFHIGSTNEGTQYIFYIRKLNKEV